jgi:hypothetical protein
MEWNKWVASSIFMGSRAKSSCPRRVNVGSFEGTAALVLTGIGRAVRSEYDL